MARTAKTAPTSRTAANTRAPSAPASGVKATPTSSVSAKRKAAPAAAKTATSASAASAKRTPAPAGTRRGKAKPPALASITLRQFATAYADEKGMKRADGVALVEEIVAKIRTHITNGTKVRFQGLGTFQIRDRPARMGRNPGTGEAIKIAASRKLVFTPAAELKDAI